MDSIHVKGHGYMERGEPWFDDGNIVIITDKHPTAFRVHRGVLARHSEIFNDMLAIPQPATEIERFEDCQIVTLYDLPSELSNLIEAIYDGPNFANRNIEDFFYIAGILRLASKYFIAHLRRQSIEFLGQTWGTTLAIHDAMLQAALSSPPVNDLSYPYVHPLHVLNLAREVDASVLVPSALYFLSLYILSDILTADHPKLRVEHSSKPSSRLSSPDLLLYSLMYQHRLQHMENFLRQFCEDRITNPICGSLETCGKAFSRLVSLLNRSWNLKTGCLHFISQVMHKVSEEVNICSLCRSNFQHDGSTLRQQIWDELPRIANLPMWAEMQVV